MKTIRLRGHHLLCLLGYHGMGYSPDFVNNMTAIYTQLRLKPQTLVTLIEGVDDLCGKFPSSQEYHCEDDNIHERDCRILKRLGFQEENTLSWQIIQSRIALVFQPSDIDALCPSCSWRKYGLCAEGIQTLKDGKELPEIP